MERWIYKILTYLFLTGMGIVHLAPYEQVWVIVLYYICQYGLMIALISSLIKGIELIRYDVWENKLLIFYLFLKMFYHIINSKCTFSDYLYKLDSEFYSGIFTFFVLGIMITFQIINLIGYVKER